MQNKKFGRLLKAAINSIANIEGKTNPIIEEEIGQDSSLSISAIQRYKSGHIPPDLHTIEKIAYMAVKRGYYYREWLIDFLQSARYPKPDILIEKLCPINSSHIRAERIYQNLPPPTYSQFIMRKEAYEELLEGLARRAAVVLLTSLGGMGKTSLIREVAARCLDSESDATKFDAVVWVSDQARPGTTSLSSVLDEIARTLDYPNLVHSELEEKKHEVEQLLRRQRVLLIIDNFETILDTTLPFWLTKMPEPSKVLVTSREYSQFFRDSTVLIELKGMSKEESDQLIQERLKALHMGKMVNDLSQLDPLVALTNGNPKAIAMALGIIKHQHQPLNQIIDDLLAARGDISDDLFKRCWSLLDETAQRLLLVMPFFVDSASTEALSAISNIQGHAFDHTMERLTDLSLIDIQHISLNSEPLYTIHSLTRVFAEAKIKEKIQFEEQARQRWINWYLDFAKKYGGIDWKDWHVNYDQLETQWNTLLAVFSWCVEHNLYDQLEIFWRRDHVLEFANMYGYWQDRLFFLDWLIQKAEQRNDWTIAFDTMGSKGYTLLLMGHYDKAKAILNGAWEMRELVDAATKLEIARDHSYLHSIQGMYDETDNWNELAEELFEQTNFQGIDYIRMKLTRVLYPKAIRLFQENKKEDAKGLFIQIMQEADKIGYQRGVINCQLQLAQIAILQNNFDEAERLLRAGVSAAEINKERRIVSNYYHALANVEEKRGNISDALSWLQKALDLFDRLNMQRELQKAIAKKAQLEAELISGNIRA